MVAGIIMRWWLISFFLLLTISQISAVTNDIHLGETMQLKWNVNYNAASVNMEIYAQGNEKYGWIAVGFSDYGELFPSDLCIFWVDWKGHVYLQDTWVDQNGTVHVDDVQDCKNFQFKYNKTGVFGFFTRKFDTCDDQDYVIQGGTTHIIYARGKGPLYRLSNLNLQSSNSAGFERTTILTPNMPKSKLQENSWTLDIRMKKVNVPAMETTYWCKIIKLPKQLNLKHHIISYEPAFDEPSNHLTHHMEVFHCATNADERIPKYEGSCQGQARPEKTKVCSKVLAAWAMGAPPFVYPEEAGSPIGGPDFNPYVMLEIHYHNPTIAKEIIDSSGFKLTITSSLRRFDSGVMELGLEYVDKFAIPPGQKRFDLSGYCIDACTGVGLPEGGVTVFASQLHTHLTGRRVYTKHVRNGVELPELNRDNHYSQHYQAIRLLRHPVRILPGDALITTCQYDTTDRTNVTLTGFSITDEMCVNYIHYFPRTDLEVCKSSISDDYLNNYFAFMNRWEDQPIMQITARSTKYKVIEWNHKRVKNLQKLYLESPIFMQCNQSSGARFPGGWDNLPVTKVSLPMAHIRHCPRSY